MGESPQIPNIGLPPLGGGVQPSGPSRKKWKKKLSILLGVVILTVLIFNPFSLIFFSVLVGSHQTKIIEAKLQKPDIYEPVARRLATYCQSDPSLFPKILSYAWLPEEVSSLGQPWCEVFTNSASIELGGVFYHFGYRLDLNEAVSTPATNVLKLFLAREEQPDKLLMTLGLASTQQVTAEDLEKLVGISFDKQIKEGNGGCQNKVMLQLRFRQTAQAAATCVEWMKAKPDSWRARFTYAHVRCRLGETEPAATQFSEWVNAHKDFANYIYLALFNYREGRTNQAVQAVRLASSQPLIEPPDAGASVYYLGQNGALIAYNGGDYDLCRSLCDKMLANSGHEKWWQQKAFKIKAAAAFMKGDQTAAIDLMRHAENANEPDPFSHEDKAKADQVLLDAIQKKNTQFIRDFQNWVDEMETWFSPFETDESEFHGGDLNVPTPYPSSWKTDKMNPNTSQ